MTYRELYKNLFDAHVVAPFYLKPLQPPYPKWYDTNTQCEYHAGIVGHSIEYCTSFKRLVEKLIKARVVKFDDAPVGRNSLPNHTDKGVNAIVESLERRIKQKVAEVRTPLREVWREMQKRGLVLQELMSKSRDARNYCEFHNKEDHEIQQYSEFRALVQELTDNKELEFFNSTEEEDVCTTEGESAFEVNHPVVIITRPRIDEARARVAPRLVIQKPVAFPYRDSKRVPWNYSCSVTCPGKESSASKSNPEAEHIEKKFSVIRQGDERTEPLVNEPVMENEAKEFLKFLKHSEYSTVEQLYKQSVCILVLALLLNSEMHRNALIKVLNETYVTGDISVNKLDHLISNISADNFISFRDDETSPGGMGSTKALHITTRCKGYTLPGVLIDNGSALNILPLSTLNRLLVDSSHMKTCQNIVRAFDGTERKIHSAGVVPSSLHQKLKLVTEGRLITINAEEDIIASVTSDAPHIKNDTEAIECSFRSLEFVNAAFISVGGKRNEKLERKRERRRARLNGAEVKWGSMTFPHISNTFVSGGIIYSGPENMNKEMAEDMMRALSINAVFEEGLEEENLAGIRPYEPGSVLDNWTAKEIPVVFRTNTESPNIDIMSNADMDPEFPYERDMGLERSRDFVDDEDCSLSPKLLRMVEREEKLILPHKETIEKVILEDEKEVKIGTCINKEARQDLIKLLLEFKDVFVWSYQDMPGLSTNIAVHRIPIKEECKPVQQKLRRIRPNVAVKIREEIKKQIDAGFLQVVSYSERVANVVPVPKKDEKVRMCVDYRDLNKASPKDNFSLPHIDTLVDNTAGYSLFFFMDGFSGYNQIKMHPEDMEKTTFITLWGTFCYKVMHKEIAVYVDDMIAKSRTENEHVQVLRKLFLRLRKFQLKLNPTKCTFGARSGKLLGFVVSERGIEVDPNKKYDPIFRLLKKHNPGIWDDECQKAFDKIKQYLPNTTVLMPPSPDRPLILYLTVFDNSMGCMLGQHDETGKKEKVICYLSKKFTECDMRYSPIEKLCCALVWTTRRLMQYMLCHTTWLISKLDPLKYMMESTALNGRMARWQILLSEFDIVYVNQKAVKGSVITDFLASRALDDYETLNFDFPNEDLMFVAATDEDTLEDYPWKLKFDRVSNVISNGVGAVLVSLNGDHYPFTCKLDFDCKNNMAEYEACIIGIRPAIDCKVKVLEVYRDSALVIYQLKGEWETRDPKLISYQKLVWELIEEFDDITFFYLLRDENQMADTLATLASMIRVNEQEGMKPIQMSICETPAHYCNIDEEEKRDDHPWYHDILRYVKSREYPNQATGNNRRTLRRLANDYVLDEEVLYKKEYGSTVFKMRRCHRG
ncbi:RNA-directed DNA polymerase (Reverse transcriptase), Ribonuclease H-like protein [Gossypium australe]|uniref:RNA-directed DNA polymerase (Reverse transcriptase), Ribonuclease H-like protein n=1 Tax=Gossypium australe TaxID=47621 RepID=A0A5B6UMC6_9ROSI|nr:RNA-directed DNA polymerase (Reverse transcriptase), Ribonuclease H-like protein [Gossypium australe]